MFTIRLVFSTKFLFHLGRSVRPDGEVLLVCDGGELLLRPALVLLDGDDTGEVRPVLEDRALPLHLPDLEEERISPSRQHEVKVEVHLSSFHVWVLDLVDHHLKGRVGPEVVEHELDAPVLEVVAGADVLGGQGHVQLGHQNSLCGQECN